MSTRASKAGYITNSLSKIRHKRWELYVISRVVHLLDDLEIEFVCQQAIILENGTHKFADMFFPQFNIYLEVNEKHHFLHGRRVFLLLSKTRTLVFLIIWDENRQTKKC